MILIVNLLELKRQPINDFNTIESIEVINFNMGKITAINHAINHAIMIGNSVFLNEQNITDLNQFLSDRIAMFNSQNTLDQGMKEGYLLVKNFLFDSQNMV